MCSKYCTGTSTGWIWTLSCVTTVILAAEFRPDNLINRCISRALPPLR